MYRRAHHRRIAQVLSAMNAPFLAETRCYFGGGTAIALQLDEYRESAGIDFLCADQSGYRRIREAIFNDPYLQALFTQPVRLLRDVRADQYGVRTVLEMDGCPIKFEIVREGRIALDGAAAANIPVLCLTHSDAFAEKLLANADRYGDRSVMSRDIIDLLMMEQHWGSIPDTAWLKVLAAYGESARHAYEKAKAMLRDARYLSQCTSTMGISQETVNVLAHALAAPDSSPEDGSSGLGP